MDVRWHQYGRMGAGLAGDQQVIQLQRGNFHASRERKDHLPGAINYDSLGFQKQLGWIQAATLPSDFERQHKYGTAWNTISVGHATTDAVTDTGASGDSAGDILTFANEVYDADDKNKIGSDQGICFRTVPGKAWDASGL
jgi:hypothetical protein